MFESGLEFVKADFHLHTRKDKEFSYSGEDNSFFNDYISSLKESNIRVGVITNHNKFDRDEYKAIRRAARREDIFILPGVELTVKEGANGIHTLIVFNPDEWLTCNDNHIQTFLTSVFATIPNPENSNAKCKYDLTKTLEALEDYGLDYFVIFAHVDQGSGLFSECDWGLLESLARLEPFKRRVLGLQKARTRDNIAHFSKCFGYLPALVEGSDPKSISDIGKGDKQTFLKLGEYSYSAVKFALLDRDNRVSATIPDTRHGYIESLSFQGGKFDGQKIVFSPALNTLIGIRGSGKSSILEVIRYLFDIPVQTDKDYKESLVKSVLGSGGKVTLSVVDKYGKRYSISRIFGERVNIINEDGNDLNISPLSLFDGVQYFGQKDLSNSTDHENSLLQKLVSGRIGQKATIDECNEEIISAIDKILIASKIPAQITEATILKTEIEHKISIYKEKGVADKLKKQSVYTADKAKLDTIQTRINGILQTIKTYYESSASVSGILEGYTSEFNDDLIGETRDVLSAIDEQLMLIGNINIQFLFATHNANIPVLGDAERVLVVEFQDTRIDVSQGNIDLDSTHKQIVDIMEGGKEAFDRRQLIYTSWR